MSLVGANPSAGHVAADRLPGSSHYLTGSDPANWQRDVPRYGKVEYKSVYDGIDLVYYGTGNPSPTTAAVLLGKAIASLPFGGKTAAEIVKPFRAKAVFRDETWEEREYTSLLAATIDQIGLGFRPFVRCEERPNTFHVLALMTKTWQLASELPRIRLGMPMDPAKARSKVSDYVEIVSTEPFAYTIDGDMHRAKERVVLEAGPRVEIIVK